MKSLRCSRGNVPGRHAARISMHLITAVLIVASQAAPAFGQQGGEDPTETTHGIEAYIAEDAIQAMYTRNMDVGELGINDVRGGFFFSEKRDFVLIGDMLVDVGRPERRPRWMLDVGPRVYGALLGDENQDIFSVALGGKLSYVFRQNGATTLSVSAFYAPDIVTFGNADNVIDVSVRFETQLTEATRIFVGYRSFEFELLDTHRRIDDGVHIGIRRQF